MRADTHPRGTPVELAAGVSGRAGREHKADPTAAGARLLLHLPTRIHIAATTAADSASTAADTCLQGLGALSRPVAGVPALETRALGDLYAASRGDAWDLGAAGPLVGEG